MINKVYVSEQASEALFEAKRDFGDACKVVDCSELSLTDFVKLQSPSLFSSKLPLIFYNVESLGSDSLCTILDTPKLCFGVWCFSKLTKESKVYKKLKDVTSIEAVKLLTTTFGRKKFIQTLNLKLSNTLLERLSEVSSTNRGFLKLEADKVLRVLNLLGEEEALRAICNLSHESNTIFTFIDHLIHGRTVQFFEMLPGVVYSESPLAFRTCMLKRLSYMLLLSQGHSTLATEYWKLFGDQVSLERKVIKRLGVQNISKLYSTVERDFDVFILSESYKVVKAYTHLMYLRDKMP